MRKLDYLFNTQKFKYVKGKKTNADCILCAIRDRISDVTVLEVHRTENFIVSVNLYPFNPGHLLVFPIRHMETFSDMNDSEALQLHHITAMTIDILKKEFNPSGFNIGCNLGGGSGASIAHIHQHIVPRYDNEIGFIDVLSGTRLVVSDPVETMHKLKEKFRTYNKY